jgi:serine/threonine-protein kinase HipA
LKSAASRILRVAGKPVLCVERYDRVSSAQECPPVRLHQEDLCQALGHYPHQKYQADGGPSAAGIVTLLGRSSDDHEADVATFIGALAFNWVIAGTDAHSKNHSLIHGHGSFLKSAPLYDLASFLPYQRDKNSTKVKLAMKIGGTYRLHEIDASRWGKWAQEASLTPDRVIGHCADYGPTNHGIRRSREGLNPCRT